MTVYAVYNNFLQNIHMFPEDFYKIVSKLLKISPIMAVVSRYNANEISKYFI